ncbi:trypsin alpha-like isoform X2 [Agrilus planipennis]|uniref:Trypsin alpha-like isoform X2 n=1 Tax=Agrilus planipennis TaxID=224129 RepID=A0A1W4WUF1_AGRPL|nr:trypsin alpha-like isoform X2 [Agrilus planipennis]
MMGVLVFVAFVPFALAFPHQQTGSSLSQPSTKIVGGSSATINEIPYIVQVYKNGGPQCGGSIISRTWVVSASHCLEGLDAANVSIRAGTDQFLKGGVVIQASDVYVHPNYNLQTVNCDIGLIKLASALSFGPTIAAISLANRKVAAGTLAVVSGWGYLAGGDNDTAPIQLQKVTLPVVSNNECPEVINESQLCAGNESEIQSSCFGDSGGPLAVGNTLIGVVSFGYDCKGVSYYANVTNLHSWISSITSI